METKKIYWIVDTHAHLYLDDFDADRNEVATRCREGIFPEVRGKNIGDASRSVRIFALVSPGISLETSRRAIELSRRYPSFIFAAVGVHPNYTNEVSDEIWNEVESLADDPNVVGIGETGLDLYWDRSPLETQIDFLRRHISLAQRKNLPIILHCRDAIQELLPVLRDVRIEERRRASNRDSALSSPFFPLRGVVHSFSETPEIASELIELGFYLGFAGGSTFTNKKFAPIGEAAKVVPFDRILLETDSPFLTPHPFRGKLERNEPLTTAFIARRLAELRGVSNEEIVAQTTRNACSLFRLPTPPPQSSQTPLGAT